MIRNTFAILAILALAAPAAALTGGPDGHGYRFIDSNEPGGPSFDWIDLENVGTPLALSDDSYSDQSLGFDFDFYGTVYDSVYVSSNGTLSFFSAYSSYSNTCLPYVYDYDLVFALWDDLNPSQGDDVYVHTVGTAPSRIFVAHWHEVPRYGNYNGDTFDFQVQLHEQGSQILLLYQDTSVGHVSYDHGVNATVGIQGDSLDGYLEYSCTTAALSDGLAIWFGTCDDVDDDGDGYTECDGDCEDTDSSVYPAAPETCGDGVDSNCDGQVDEQADDDGDGYTNCTGDCDDFNADAYPNNPEVCDLADNDCDGDVDEGFDGDGDGFSECQGDCDDADAAVYPGQTEVCNGIDDDCDVSVDEGFDADNDNWFTCDGDCDDTDDTVYPGAPELCDGLDNDCNGATDEYDDADGDGYDECDGDCDDADPAVNPGEIEVQNLIDDDCDGVADEDFVIEGDVIIAELMHDPLAVLADYGEWFELFNTAPFDINLLGWVVTDGLWPGETFTIQHDVIVPAGGVVLLANDDDPGVNGGLPAVDYEFARASFVLGSGATEHVILVLDGLAVDSVTYDVTTWPYAQGYSVSLDPPDHDSVANDDLDSWCLADDAWTYGDGDRGSPGVRNHPCCVDEDGDGETTCGADGINGTGDEDCDDADPDFHPGAVELCDGLDNDCDGALPVAEQDVDGDGHMACLDDCDDGNADVYPLATEICDGVADNNCDGNLDYNDMDDDGDGVAECDGDCSDLLAEVYPGAPELCDGLDNDCNGTADDGVVFDDWFEDADGDGYGNAAVSQSTCNGAPGPDWVADDTDCDDANPSTNPGATEACQDGADQDCDGLIDEDDPDCAGDDDTGDDDTGDDDTGDDDTGDDDTGDDDTGDDDTAGDDDDDDDDDVPPACSCRKAPAPTGSWVWVGLLALAIGIRRRA